VIRSMTYVHSKIKLKGLHYDLISLNIFTMHETHFYRRIELDKYGNQI
jgi:hypothetical protein